MNILFIGDIFGRPGRSGFKKALPLLRERYAPDFLIVNCENSAGGKGVTREIVNELLDQGVDVLTGGNHSLHQKGCEPLFDEEERLIRPANYPPGTPGRGWTIAESAAGFPVAVLNICGRAFMENFDDPFRTVSQLITQARKSTPLIIVDFHAETTSEKMAMGWFLDGQVTAVIGTHTHIQTADERVLPNGTGYITDAGMSGPYDSVIGADREAVLEALMTLRPKRFEVAAARDVRVCGAFLEVDPIDGQTRRIERVRVDLGDL
jgi:metallophosphoesterase (TIGR00282 family)